MKVQNKKQVAATLYRAAERLEKNLKARAAQEAKAPKKVKAATVTADVKKVYVFAVEASFKSLATEAKQHGYLAASGTDVDKNRIALQAAAVTVRANGDLVLTNPNGTFTIERASFRLVRM